MDVILQRFEAKDKLLQLVLRAQETSGNLIKLLLDQNATVLTSVGFFAALTTSGLTLQLMKQKEERNLENRKNVQLVPSDLIYNYPAFGHSLGFPSDPIEFWKKIGEIYKYYNEHKPDVQYVSLMFGPWPMIVPMHPEATEQIFRSQTNIYKGKFYDFFLPWLQTGLLTSTAAKWKDRRRLLTPAFHKHVLEDYLETMNEKADIMINSIRENCKVTGQNKIEVQNVITMCALDIIIETAMGQTSDLQSLGHDNEYVQAIYDVMNMIQKRQKSVWLWPDVVFKMTKDGKKFDHALKILLDFTRNVIKARWADYNKMKTELGDNFEAEYFGESKSTRKHRLSFLDTLLNAMDKGEIDMEGCCEEVDTFMFEGHDTTSAAMTWTIQEIGNNESVLAKCLDEIDAVFGDSKRPASLEDLNMLKYLDACIKEGLRKFPSVPIYARELVKDEHININKQSYLLEKGSLYVIPSYYLHRDKKHWTEPLKYMPERFLDGAADKRFAYSYTPFSAGSRNCIGQKFALLEEKVLISKMLRNFKWKSERQTNDIPVNAEIITRPVGGCFVELEDRTCVKN